MMDSDFVSKHSDFVLMLCFLQCYLAEIQLRFEILNTCPLSMNLCNLIS